MNKIYLHSGILAAAAACVILSLSACTRNASNQPAAEQKSDSTAVAASAVYIGDIAFFNVDVVIDNYDKAADLMSEFQNKSDKAAKELERKGNQIQSDYNKLMENVQKGLILQSSAEKQAQDIQSRQDKFNKDYATKQNELAAENEVIQRNIMNDIAEYVKEYNQTRGFRMILANTTGLLSMPVALADPAMDITEDIIKGLNDAYTPTK